MRKEIITLACAIGLLGTTSSAFAGAYGEPVQAEEAPVAAPAPVVAEETEIDYSASGPYIGVGGLYAIEMFENKTTQEGTALGRLHPGNSGGFQVNAGYRVIPNLALEARYEYYSEFDTDSPRAPSNSHINGYSVTANAKAFLLTGRWQPYVLVGLGYLSMEKDGIVQQGGTKNDSDDGGFAMRFGGGMEAYLTENISFGPEIAYVLPIAADNINNLDFLTVGAGLRFHFR
jgi:opacity protein-like surface antigen